jgi:hypothetical protein
MNNSTTTSPFLATECTEIETTLQRKYAVFAGKRRFKLEGQANGQSVALTLILKSDDESFFYPVEGQIAHSEQGLSQRNAAEMLLDLMDSYFQEYLVNGGEVYLPLDWQEYEVDGNKMQLRGQIQNLKLEKMADDLLAGHN